MRKNPIYNREKLVFHEFYFVCFVFFLFFGLYFRVDDVAIIDVVRYDDAVGLYLLVRAVAAENLLDLHIAA